MGTGARILAYDTPFNREALGPDAATFSLDPPDLVDLLRVALAETPDAETARRDAARRRTVEHYPIKAVADAYEAILSEAAGQRRGRRIRISTRWADPPE
jgi:glycosyltransferase involved in cell wall biosynthesis